MLCLFRPVQSWEQLYHKLKNKNNKKFKTVACIIQSYFRRTEDISIQILQKPLIITGSLNSDSYKETQQLHRHCPQRSAVSKVNVVTAFPHLYLLSFSSLPQMAVLQNSKDLKKNGGTANNNAFYIDCNSRYLCKEVCQQTYLSNQLCIS